MVTALQMLMHGELEEVQIVESLLEMGGSSLGGEVMMVKRIVRSSSKITSPTWARRWSIIRAAHYHCPSRRLCCLARYTGFARPG